MTVIWLNAPKGWLGESEYWFAAPSDMLKAFPNDVLNAKETLLRREQSVHHLPS